MYFHRLDTYKIVQPGKKRKKEHIKHVTDDNILRSELLKYQEQHQNIFKQDIFYCT
jgi:hypothetical protein